MGGDRLLADRRRRHRWVGSGGVRCDRFYARAGWYPRALDRRVACRLEREHGGGVCRELAVALFRRAHGAERYTNHALAAGDEFGGADGLVRWRASRAAGRRSV